MNVVSTYHLGIPSRDGKSAMLAVCVHDPLPNKFAVYLGIVQLPSLDNQAAYNKAREQAAQWVAFNGVKQSYQKALAYFPGLKAEDYRH